MPLSAKLSTGSSSGNGDVIARAWPVSRVASVDAYRGFVMFLMMAEILTLPAVAEALPGNAFWRFLAFNQSHVEWTWLSLHDMIQPSFTFLVGEALPFSLASRQSKGAGTGAIIRRAITRSVILIALGIFLRSMNRRQTYFTFEDTLTQIGLGYPFLVILGLYSPRIQLISLIVVLVGYWLAFAAYPLPAANFDYPSVGVAADWEYNFRGFAAHWNKNSNMAWAFDRWFLNLFPREKPFLFSRGGYSTLSFIPTLGTMILGLFAGNTLRNPIGEKEKIRNFIITGLCLLALGTILQLTGINPVVKKIWTPAWTIFSGGACFLMLALFYGVIDVGNHKKWSYFFVIIGANSIAAYVMADAGLRSLISDSLHIHFGQHYDQVFGAAYATLVNGTLVLLLMWLILRWMFNKKLFLKI